MSKQLTHSVNKHTKTSFPTIPPTINILGNTVKAARKRPVGTVHFASAKLFLSKVERAVVLCDNKGALFQSLEEGV